MTKRPDAPGDCDQTDKKARQAAGEFVRGVSVARNIIGASEEFPAEAGRYHLYVAFNCPWCHLTAMTRAVLGLEEAVSMDVLFPGRTMSDDPRGENLWRFAPEGIQAMNKRFVKFPECTEDTVGGKKYVVDIYAESGLMTEKSVPILYDKKTKRVVNNESSEIIRMFTTALAPFAKNGLDLYPTALREQIDEMHKWIYNEINNGAYKAGFSSNQDAYEANYKLYFDAFGKIEKQLTEKKTPFFLGETATEADIRAFTTLWRHDPIYHNRMKLNQAFLWEYPQLWAWMARMMQLPGMESVAGAHILAHAKQGYFGRTGNSTVPMGPKGYPDCYGKPRGTW